MDHATIAILIAAGLAGGLANAIAGGATLITFPAMLMAGLPPITANASNAVAVAPGHMVAAIADRSSLPGRGRTLVVALAAATAGGGVGAVLLLVTPEAVFTLLVPALIGSATLLYAYGKHVQKAAMATFGEAALSGPTPRAATVLAASIYGGYFGAGLGVVLLAVIAVTGHEEVRVANALKNLLSTAVSAVAIAIFISKGAVSWPPTLVMLAGAAAGGLIGAHLVKVLSPAAVRGIVITIGAAMTAIYAWRYWLVGST